MISREEIENVESQFMRGLVLQNLKQKYPNGVDFVVLRRVLELQGHKLSNGELAKLIEYLYSGEYVKVIYFKKYILAITLTNKGINLLEKSIQDVGIFVE